MANPAPGASSALIPVFVGKIVGIPTQLCNARDLHEFLRVGRDFSNWIKGRIEEYGFVRGEDYRIEFSPKPAKNSRGRPITDYHLSLDMAKELAMVENNEQGRAARRYFTACEREAHEAARAPALPPPDPSYRVIPAPPTLIPYELRGPIDRKVMELAWRAQRDLRLRVEALVRERLDAGHDEDGIAAWLETLNSPEGDMVMVCAGTLRRITARSASLALTVETLMEHVHALEAETGREWYGRGR